MRATHSAGVGALLAGLLASGYALAGGPLAIRTSGDPFTWSTATIQYRTDGGPLSASVNNAAGIARVNAMFDVWEDVPSASISYNRAGAINDVAGFSDGNVSTAAEYNAVDGSCSAGNQSPIVYRRGRSIFMGSAWTSSPSSASPAPAHRSCARPHPVRHRRDERPVPGRHDSAPFQDLTAAEFNATFVHEFGHFSGLDHSQVNWECGFGPCGTDNLAGLPTMFPFLVAAQQGSLSIDDIGWISTLYPAGGAGGFNATHGTITGIGVLLGRRDRRRSW